MKRKKEKQNRTDKMNKKYVMTGKRELNQVYGMKFDVYILVHRVQTNIYNNIRHRQLDIHSFIFPSHFLIDSSTHTSIHSFITPSHLLIHSSIPSTYPFIHPSIDLSTYLSACLPVFLISIKVD